MNEKFNELIGYEGDIIDLSNQLVILGCEDICEFGNWADILDDGNVVVATDELGEEQIQMFFDVICKNNEDEAVEYTCIRVNKIEKF